MERQAIAESGDGDTVVIGAEKVADMEQQSGKASERGFDLNSVDVAEGYKPVSMLNKLQEMQAQEDLKAMETSEVDVDVEDIPEVPKQPEEDDEDEGPEQKEKGMLRCNFSSVVSFLSHEERRNNVAVATTPIFKLNIFFFFWGKNIFYGKS